MGKILMLKDVRLSFPKLGEPEFFQGVKSRPDEKPRWSAAFHVDAKDPQKAQVDAALKEVAKEQWAAKADTYLANILGDPKASCWIDGARKEQAGVWIISSHRPSDKGRPLVFDTDKSPIYQPNNDLYPGKAGRIYSGMYVNAQIEIWAQDNKSGKGLRCTLLGIQRVRDGQAFGGGAAPSADAFAEIADGSDADDLV